MEKENMIMDLKNALKLKELQMDTLKGTFNLKDDQIKSLNDLLKHKEDLLKHKEEEIKILSDKLVNQSVLEEKDKKIEALQKEIELINSELAKADEDIEQLELENETLREKKAKSTDIIEFTDYNIAKSVIVTSMKEILQRAIHNVTIAVPNIIDLQDLYLFEVRSSVNVMISCLINPGLKEHWELIEELDTMDNIALRHFEREDRFVILRDGEELLFAVKGKKETNFIVFQTRDSAHIKALNNLVMERWLRSKKIG